MGCSVHSHSSPGVGDAGHHHCRLMASMDAWLGDLVGMRSKSCPHVWDAVPVPNTHWKVGQGGAAQHPTLLAGVGAGGVQQDGH